MAKNPFAGKQAPPFGSKKPNPFAGGGNPFAKGKPKFAEGGASDEGTAIGMSMRQAAGNRNRASQGLRSPVANLTRERAADSQASQGQGAPGKPGFVSNAVEAGAKKFAKGGRAKGGKC